MEEYNCMDIDFFGEDHQASVICFHDDDPKPNFGYVDTVRSRPTIFGANK